MLNLNTLISKLNAALANETEESLREWFRDDTPKGWVDIEEHLPQMLAEDFLTGTTYKVRFKDGGEGTTIVCDHYAWYMYAHQAGITHWYNPINS